MENSTKFVYVTKSGRQSNQKHINYNFSSRDRVIRSAKMPLLTREEERVIEPGTSQCNERSQLERERKELEELRNVIQNEMLQLESLRQQRNQQQPLENIENSERRERNEQNNVSQQICSAIGNLNLNNIEMKVPKFKDECVCNPREFLLNLEKFFLLKNIKPENKMLLVELTLEGKAKLWIELKGNFDNYEQFKIEFLRELEFYSIPVMVKAKSKLALRKYNENSLQVYYFSQIKEAKYFEPPMDTFEINHIISLQFPHWVQKALTTVDLNDTNAMSQALARLDDLNIKSQGEYVHK